MPHILHRIRLQGPWEVLPPGSSPDDVPWPVEIPASWRDLFGETSGSATFFRRFNTPTGLEPGDQLWIRLPDGCGEVASVRVNKKPVVAVADAILAFDITTAAGSFNELEITLAFSPIASSANHQAGGLWQPVFLEIVRLP